MRESGIYFLIYHKSVVYIGQSKDVHTRIKSHKYEKKKVFDELRIIKCAENRLTHYEHRLINYFKPLYNKEMSLGKCVGRRLKEPTVTIRVPLALADTIVAFGKQTEIDDIFKFIKLGEIKKVIKCTKPQ